MRTVVTSGSVIVWVCDTAKNFPSLDIPRVNQRPTTRLCSVSGIVSDPCQSNGWCREASLPACFPSGRQAACLPPVG
jgi:hypothetical protein